jgi:hypothetical protein
LMAEAPVRFMLQWRVVKLLDLLPDELHKSFTGLCSSEGNSNTDQAHRVPSKDNFSAFTNVLIHGNALRRFTTSLWRLS